MEQKHFEHLLQINQYWKEIFSSLLILNKVDSNKASVDIDPYIAQLSLLPVSKENVFRDMQWNYDAETSNRSASVGRSHVRLDFDTYTHIPLGVITEIKCLFLNVYASPKDFGHQQNDIKPNTLIGVFGDGLRFLDFVFNEVEKRLGQEYVQAQCSKLSEITLLDFEEAAKKTTLKISSKKKRYSCYKYFFGYLNCQKTKDNLGFECQADYGALKKAYEDNCKKIYDAKEEKLPYLETKVFDSVLKNASFNVVSFLYAVGEKVNDPVMAKYYEVLATTHKEFPFSKQEFEDYGAYRLSQKGYSLADINSVFPENQVAKFGSDVQSIHSMVKTNFGKKIKFTESLRVTLNEVFYSSLWVIGLLMGARPNVYSDLKIHSCLDLKNNTIIAEEHKGRDNRWNLFNDRWVAIPIMIDAIKVVELIGGKVFQNTYVFGNVNTSYPDEINTPMTALSHTVKQGFWVLTGISPKNIKSNISAYLFRHSLAHQMIRADVGLPVISYQLKHIVSAAEALARKGKVSQTTLGYGGIANQLISKVTNGKLLDLRHAAELEGVKANFNPNGKYMGGKADEHLSKIKKFFNGCMEAGYTEENIYEAMVEQGLAIINVGSGYCFGGVEDFDETLPCIGGLRCNPVRCHNAIVTKANAPKWREIYLSNLKLIGVEGYEDRQDQIAETIEESKRVLEYLGEGLI